MQRRHLPNRLKIWETNAECLRTKIGELNNRANTSKPDVICVVESHGAPTLDPPAALQIDGYTDYRRDRLSQTKWSGEGGVITYVRTGLLVSPLNSYNNPSSACEMMCLKIELQNSQLFFCAYRSPSDDVSLFAFLERTIDHIHGLKRGRPVIVVTGDLNHHDLLGSLDSRGLPKTDDVVARCKSWSPRAAFPNWSRTTRTCGTRARPNLFST
eukprot:gnl/Spiro4/5160_TR2587_c0_g3_i1.p1 gnl/Spiro4/5160_TR2587_c0_g3~~gnl/Spiro4/5160_TR2587_c0_g3_i1.p1  ORF type:complete len:213 (-),score=26.42 gnl/Spiro4/5160_TR2587_c0_g3_i1:1346-1984(-)